MSLSILNSTNCLIVNRTPRHNCILEIKQDYGCDSSKLHYDRSGVKIFNCQMRFTVKVHNNIYQSKGDGRHGVINIV